MKNLRFRAWDKEKKIMIYDGFCICPREKISHDSVTHIIETPSKKVYAQLHEEDQIGDYTLIDWSNWYGIENLIVEQWTGYTDKNGVDIFEGDVVYSHKAKEIISENACAKTMWEWEGYELEVLGNIHQEDELKIKMMKTILKEK